VKRQHLRESGGASAAHCGNTQAKLCHHSFVQSIPTLNATFFTVERKRQRRIGSYTKLLRKKH
jgi:hypothetical protein